MSAPGWLTENSLRSYPLAVDPARRLDKAGAPVPLPTQALVDFGSDAGGPALFETGGDLAYLDSISRSGSTITFVVRSTASGLAGKSLAFRRRVDDAEFTTEFAEAAAGEDDCGPIDLWRGFLTTGPLAPLLDVLGDGDVLGGGPAFAFERSLTRSLSASRVRTIRLANYERLVAVPGTQLAYSPGVRTLRDCIAPTVVFGPGYSVSVHADDAANALTFASAAGGGLGEPCGEMAAYPGEGPPAGSPYLSGGPGCGELITSVSGQYGKRLRLIGGAGVSVTTDPDSPHRIVVDFAMTDLGSCPS